MVNVSPCRDNRSATARPAGAVDPAPPVPAAAAARLTIKGHTDRVVGARFALQSFPNDR
jgi:hypothetical protein